MVALFWFIIVLNAAVPAVLTIAYFLGEKNHE